MSEYQFNDVYKNIRRKIMICNIIAAAFASILELIIIPIYYINNLFGEDTLLSFMIDYTIKPMISYVLIIILFIFIIKKNKNEMIKNLAPLISMCLLIIVIIKQHYVFNVVLILPIVPMCLSVAYGSQLITGMTSIASVISYTIGIILTFTHGNSEYSTYYLYDIVIGYVMLIGLYITVKTVVDSEQEKQRLIMKVNKERLVLKYAALHDERTEIANVKGLELAYNEWRFSKNAYIAIIDIDHFKTINDTYGHTFGDVVLNQLGKLLKKIANKDVFVARYGGEEFVLIIRNTTFDDAKNVLYNLLEMFSSLKFKEAANMKLTFSGGLCKINPTKDLSYNVAYADTYLYDAKENGRNKIYGTDSYDNRNTLLSKRQSRENKTNN